MTNRIEITGGIGQDPEFKYLESGRAVLNFSVGDNKSKPDGNGGWTEVRPTIWHRVALWGPLAEMFHNAGVIKKGARVEVFGEQTIREFEHNGEKRWSSDITAHAVRVLEPRNQQAQGGGFDQTTGFDQMQQTPPPQQGGWPQTNQPPSQPPANDVWGNQPGNYDPNKPPF